jgi:O-phosphoseryl-tRNA(Cys) synthetase|tara:strand:- start:499 stop:666 length:168 start_codon:yes stop_codon:yes gene_type:complete
MFLPEELTVIRQGLDTLTISGKDAKALSTIQIKVENEIQKQITKKEKELEKAMKK